MNNTEQTLIVLKTMEALTKVLPEGKQLDGILEELDKVLGEVSKGIPPEEMLMLMLK